MVGVLLKFMMMGTAFAAPHLHAPSQAEVTVLLKQHPEIRTECEDQSVEFFTASLSVSATNSKDILTVCNSACGQGGCEYQVYENKNNKFQKIGQFFGRFEISNTVTAGRYDIEVKSRMGIDTKRDFTLKYNGQSYK
jgi:hypothetical protein